MSDDDNLAETAKGTAKEIAGKLTGKDDLAREGQEQQEKAEANEDAERLEEMAQEKRQEAAGHQGAQTAASLDD